MIIEVVEVENLAIIFGILRLSCHLRKNDAYFRFMQLNVHQVVSELHEESRTYRNKYCFESFKWHQSQMHGCWDIEIKH